jgi:anti-anti-sigma regulatory factor
MLIDLGECEFIDSSAVAALFELQRSLDGAGSTVFGLVAGRQPRRTLRIAAVDQVMPVFDHMSEALQTLKGARRDDTT